ncbi:MAG TPA: hypothetical protein VKQ08_09295 [Cyclobacteriaceae bacterium]|nr:hypothetical protein [Cyclobacteriaceae bacterium]
MAQPGPPPDPDVPITGLEVLIAGGAAYGFRKLINRRKSNPKL